MVKFYPWLNSSQKSQNISWNIQKKNAISHTFILDVKRNPLFLQIEWKNNGFLFTDEVTSLNKHEKKIIVAKIVEKKLWRYFHFIVKSFK